MGYLDKLDGGPSRSTGIAPVSDGYEYIGAVTRTIGDGVTSFGQESTDLWSCPRCGVVVTDAETHERAAHIGRNEPE